MGKIFVSYSRDESKKVYKILDGLRAHKIDFWVDTIDIKNGKYWDEEISKAIINSKKFFLFMSKLSMSSPNTAKEIKIASTSRKSFIILRLDEVKYPNKLKYALEGLQWTNHWEEDWKSKIVSVLIGRSPLHEGTDSSSHSLPSYKAKSTRPISLQKSLAELESMFSASGEYYKDQCETALFKLSELRKLVGAHWVNPSLAYRHLIPRVTVLEKIDDLQELIKGFQSTCPPGNPTRRMAIQYKIEELSSELNKK